MRPIAVIFMFFFPAVALADGHATSATAVPIAQSGGFKLGGAASRAALVPLQPEPPVRRALRLPTISIKPETGAQSALGPATVFMRESLDFGRDALQLGTFLSRGQARAGVSLTYTESTKEVSQSQIFLDYALTEQFSIGVAGILDNELNEEEPVRQLGLNAGYATEGGAFLRGGIASADDYDPVFGLSIGLRF